MNSQIAACSDLPCARHTAEVNAIQHLRKHRASRACHPALQTDRFKPVKGLADLGTLPHRDGLQIVTSEVVRVCCKA
jgi:hypothetical protein